MLHAGMLLSAVFLLGVSLGQAQLEGGLLGVLKPEGTQISLPGLLGLTDKRKTTTTTTTTTTTPPPPPTPAPVPTRRTHKPVASKPPCHDTPTRVQGKASCKDKLILQENFGKLNDNKWTIEQRFAGEPDYEFVIYQGNTDHVFTKSNRLHIKPSLTEDSYGAGYVSNPEGINLGDACTGEPTTFECVQKPKAWQILPPVISGQVSTRNHFSFLYGVIEIKARLPKGDWIYPEIYLKPKSEYYGPGYKSGTIQIAFLPGNAGLGRQLTGGVILSELPSGRSFAVRSIRSDGIWNDDFHVFKVEWKPDRIIFSVDDHVYANIEPPNGGFVSEHEQLELDPETAEEWRLGTKLAPFDKEMYLVLGVGVGGQSFLDETHPNKPWNNDDPKAQLTFYRNQSAWHHTWNQHSQLVVDYVKVYAL